MISILKKVVNKLHSIPQILNVNLNGG